MSFSLNDQMYEKIETYCDGRVISKNDLTELASYAFLKGVSSENKRVMQFLLRFTNMTEEDAKNSAYNTEEGKERWETLFGNGQ